MSISAVTRIDETTNPKTGVLCLPDTRANGAGIPRSTSPGQPKRCSDGETASGRPPGSWTTCMDIGGRFTGTVSGAMNMMGNFGGVVSPIVLGAIVQRTGDWNLTFYLTGALYFVGAEEGATALIAGNAVHEWTHDGRHLLGVPCH